jgi:uncharacterized protein (TIGR02678 family)
LETLAEGLLAVDRDRLATDDDFPAPNNNAKQVALLLTDSLVVDDGAGRRLVERTLDALTDVVSALLDRHPNWAKGFRDGDGPRQLASQAVDVLCAFGLAECDGDTVRPRPALARYRAAPATRAGPTLWEEEP